MNSKGDFGMKFLTFFLMGFASLSAFANDEVVSARVTCADIQAGIAELSGVVEPDAETIDELTKLKADYRRSCSRSARGRKSSASSRVVVQSVAVDVPQDEAVADEKKAEDVVVAQKAEADVVEEIENADVEKEQANTENVAEYVADATAEQTEEVVAEPTEDELLELELKNLEAGLCADGSKPNKYGCCGDELFKDLGNAVFACCPKEGGDCFPPIK